MSTYGRLLLTFCDAELRIEYRLLRTMFLDLDFDKLQDTAEAIGVKIVV